MASFFKTFILKVKLSPGITALYSNIVIDQIGSGMVGLFMPIFLWQTFGDLNLVLLYYFLVHGLYAFGVFFGAKIMSHIGLKSAMILSIPFKVLFYGSLYYLSVGYPILIFTAIMISVIEIRMMLFWVPYHTDFAEFTNKRTRGRVMGFLSAISSVVAIFIPLISGWIISNHGFQVLFLIAIVLISVSIVPLFLVKPTYEKFTFTFSQTWKNLWAKRYRKMTLCKFADGIENSVGAIMWPIFIFQVLNGNFFEVGALSSLIVLVTVVVKLGVGNLTDKFDKRKLMKVGSGLYAIGWFFKIFVNTGFDIFIASSYHNFSQIVMKTPFDALIYEKAADSGHYVDEITVMKEIALNLGRASCIILLFVIVNTLGISWAFAMAAVASLFVNIL